MTDPDGTIARIDAELEAWETGPDAYRWEADAEPGEERVPQRLEFVNHDRIWLIPDLADPEAPTQAEIDAGIELTDALRLDVADEPIFTPGMRGAIRVDGEDIPIVIDEVCGDTDGGSVRFTVQREEDT